MSKVLLHTINASFQIERKAIKCPFCGITMIPDYIYGVQYANSLYDVLTKCTNEECHLSFITRIDSNDSEPMKILPSFSFERVVFSDIICNMSNEFNDIFNQAYSAEQMNLNQICGIGYRKALEFLIKDYLIYTLPEENHDTIKSTRLGSCIDKFVSNVNIKEVAKRAAWLGNDETHYQRKWENKDVKDLKSLIFLVTKWIEMEEETKALKEEMPDPNNK